MNSSTTISCPLSPKPPSNMKSIALVAFGLAGGDDHAFARRQSVGLDHHGKAQTCGEDFGRAGFAETLIARRWECRFRRKGL